MTDEKNRLEEFARVVREAQRSQAKIREHWEQVGRQEFYKASNDINDYIGDTGIKVEIGEFGKRWDEITSLTVSLTGIATGDNWRVSVSRDGQLSINAKAKDSSSVDIMQASAVDYTELLITALSKALK